MSDMRWTITALKYADRNARVRADSFLFNDHPSAPHGMDYFIWVLQSGDRTILVDTGYDAAEGARRNAPVLRDPVEALAAIGLDAAKLDTVVITHLHYDHAGGLDRYPSARFHVQAAEMAFATGPCMCSPVMRHAYTVDHVCEMLRHVYSGRVVFHDGDGQIAPGVTVHRVGGHSRGMQVVCVATDAGPVCLASDATHYYENFQSGIPFPLVVDVEDMIKGFSTIRRLAGGDDTRVIPGHDPLVTQRFAPLGHSGFAWSLHKPL